MTSSPIHIGVFARDIDCIFYSSDLYTYIYIVENQSVAHRWICNFIHSDQILTYDMSDAHDPDNGIMSILTTSDLLQKIKTKQIRYLHTTEIVTKEIEALSYKYGVTWIATPPAQHEQFENKLWFDRFLTEHNISRPKSTNYSVGEPLPFTDTVLQQSHSWGSEGTYFVTMKKQIEELVSSEKIRKDESLLAREKINGTTYGVSLFIAPGIVAVSALRIQCFQADNKNHSLFMGVQWVKTGSLDSQLVINMNDVLHKLGAALYKEKYLGYANIDFIVDENNTPYIIECNARYSAATTHVAWKPELMHSLPAHEIFAQTCIDKNQYTQEYVYRGIPQSDFTGTMIDLDVFPEGTHILHNAKDVGIYTLSDEITYLSPDITKHTSYDILYFSEFVKGDVISENKTVGYLFTSFPLCDGKGELNTTGLKVKTYYAY